MTALYYLFYEIKRKLRWEDTPPVTDWNKAHKGFTQNMDSLQQDFPKVEENSTPAGDVSRKPPLLLLILLGFAFRR